MRIIPEYSDYVIFRDGSVYSLKNNCWLKARYNCGGYKKVDLWKQGVRKTFYVHRLVAHVFIINDEDKIHVHHIDSVRDNNHVTNLMWVTVQENNEFRDKDLGEFEPIEDIPF